MEKTSTFFTFQQPVRPDTINLHLQSVSPAIHISSPADPDHSRTTRISPRVKTSPNQRESNSNPSQSPKSDQNSAQPADQLSPRSRAYHSFGSRHQSTTEFTPTRTDSSYTRADTCLIPSDNPTRKSPLSPTTVSRYEGLSRGSNSAQNGSGKALADGYSATMPTKHSREAVQKNWMATVVGQDESKRADAKFESLNVKKKESTTPVTSPAESDQVGPFWGTFGHF